MAILLKTASVRVCSIQIMQVRVQNKGNSVWKSRYEETYQVLGASHKGFKSRQEGEASYLRFTLARERTRNRHLMYCIVPLSLIVIALLAYTFV